MRLFLRLTLCLSIAQALSACSTSPTRDSSRRGVFPGDRSHLLKGREAADYKEIQTLFNRGSYEALLPKVTAYTRKYPQGAQISHVANFHGLAYLLTRRPVEAIQYFKRSIERAPHPVFKEYVLYNLAAAQFEAGLNDDCALTLSQIHQENFDRDTRVKFHTLQGRIFLKQGRNLEAARETLSAARLVDPAIARTAYGTQLDQALQGVSDLPRLESLYHDYEDTPIADGVLYRLGALEIGQGKMGAGESRLRRLMENYPDSPRFRDSKQLLQASQSQNEIDPLAVGVLLPLKGRYAKFGQQALQAIQLAFKIFNPEEPESKVTLIIQDSGEDTESAVQGLNNLFFKHHVVGIIGPLLSKGVEQVTQKAQELGIPLLTLTQQTGTKGEYIFSGGITPQVQAEEIARHAIEKLGLHKFAIIYPKDRFGEEYSQAYWDALASLGGQVVGIESYRPGETDFRQVIDRLVGTYYPEARQRELDAMAQDRETNSITKRSRKTEQFFALKPIIDFEAVFIPDQPKVVGQILPTFAYRDVDRMQYLGISTWHSPELLSRAQGHAEGARFADAFNAKSETPAVQNFVARFRNTFDHEPGQIEANAFDIGSLLAQVLDSTTPVSRPDLRDALAAVTNFHGITGAISFKNGSFVRNLTILAVKGSHFVPAK